MSHQNMPSPHAVFDPTLGVAVTSRIDYTGPYPEESTGVLGFGVLEWSFVTALIVLVGAVGLFALFLGASLFRNPTRR